MPVDVTWNLGLYTKTADARTSSGNGKDPSSDKRHWTGQQKDAAVPGINNTKDQNNMNRTLQIKNLTIKNRFAVPPMVCFHWTDDNGYVTDKNIEHYRELAKGGFGLIIVEATAITKRSRLADTELGIWEDGQIEGLKKITDVIHENGAKTFIQLLHAGGNGIDPTPDAPSSTVYRDRNHAVEMSKDTIKL